MKDRPWTRILGEIGRNSSMQAVLLITSIFLFMFVFYLATGITPNHDSMEWEGATHYFYTCLGKGVFPYWNPYSQTGTPFFINCQGFGLLEPSNYLFIAIMKMTGCSTVTAYVMHFLFYYLVFMLGAYFLLKFITEEPRISLLFSLILLLATFPVAVRQNGIIHYFYLLPFITILTFMFFRELNPARKGFYFFMSVLLTALMFHIYIPSALIFYIVLIYGLAILLKIVKAKDLILYFITRHGLLWLSFSVITMLLLIAPVLALYHEFQSSREIFPSVRIMQKNNVNLIKTYASDFPHSLFDEKFSNNQKTCLSIYNVVGFFTEPIPLGSFYPMNFDKISEVRIYISIFPLLCAFLAVLKWKERAKWIYSALAAVFLFLSCNFMPEVLTEPSLLQNAILTIFPLLRKVEVLQNLGGLLVLMIIILGAVGMKQILKDGNRTILLFSLGLVFLKFAVLIHKWFQSVGLLMHFPGDDSLIWVLFIAFIAALVELYRHFRRLSFRPLLTATLVVLLVDLLFFNYFYIDVKQSSLYNKYHGQLKREGKLHAGFEKLFLDYREPYLVPSEFFNSFFGYEIYHTTKVAMPTSIRDKIFETLKKAGETSKDEPDVTVNWDHFYMTTSYYDYLVNVGFDKQLAASGVVFPILNFFPRDRVVPGMSKYEIVKRLNESSIEELGRKIYLEGSTRERPSMTSDVGEYFGSGNYLKYPYEECANFASVMRNRRRFRAGADIKVMDFGINHLSVRTHTNEDGYLFFGDGYHSHWRASVNGRPVKIERANINFKAVFLEKGESDVRFEFDPLLFRMSLRFYLAGIVLALLLVGWGLSMGGGGAGTSASLPSGCPVQPGSEQRKVKIREEATEGSGGTPSS